MNIANRKKEVFKERRLKMAEHLPSLGKKGLDLEKEQSISLT